jgi:hypothetical protein
MISIPATYLNTQLGHSMRILIMQLTSWIPTHCSKSCAQGPDCSGRPRRAGGPCFASQVPEHNQKDVGVNGKISAARYPVVGCSLTAIRVY